MKFAHIGDCHLGGWKQPELMQLNMESFEYAIDSCITEKVDCVIIAGDLFDSAYPSIETVKHAFGQFRKLYERKIPVFFIAGSHDYSVSGKSFLDVLEHAGFAKNISQPEERNNALYLSPVIYKNLAMYGYPGKKSGLEVHDIARIKLHSAPGLFSVLVLHTAIRDAVGSLPIPAVDHEALPKTDYLALAHLHIVYQREGRAYSGPLFPNNALELEELQGGSFYIVHTSGKLERKEVRLRPVTVLPMHFGDTNPIQHALENLDKFTIRNAVVILKVSGIIDPRDTESFDFRLLEKKLREAGAYVIIRETSKLKNPVASTFTELPSTNIEEQILQKFEQDSTSDFKKYASALFTSLQMEKKEDEKSAEFEKRVSEEARKIMEL